MAARTTAVVSFAICFIFGVGCSWRGPVANGGSWGGCVDNAGSWGVVLEFSTASLGRSLEEAFFLGFVLRFWGLVSRVRGELNKHYPVWWIEELYRVWGGVLASLNRRGTLDDLERGRETRQRSRSSRVRLPAAGAAARRLCRGLLSSYLG